MREKLYQDSATRMSVKQSIVTKDTNTIFITIFDSFEEMSLKFRKPHIEAMIFLIGCQLK